MNQDIIAMAREAGAWAQQSKNCDVEYVMSGQSLERFATLVAAAERESCSRMRAAKPRELKPVGMGTLLDEQQYCFNNGWREGAASVRAAIRARGETK